MNSISSKVESIEKYDFANVLSSVAAAKAALDADPNSEALKNAYKSAVTAADSMITLIHNYTQSICLDAQNAAFALEDARNFMTFIEENSELPAQIINDYKAHITEVEPILTQIAAVETEKVAYAKECYNKIKGYEGTTSVDFVKEIITRVELPESPKKEEEVVSKYISDENKIVLVTYSNGTSFILNFNDYAITTVINDTVYTVNAYGYVVFK